jgi:DNA modification methylase
MELPINKILNGDCLEHLKELPDNSIDCVITDPPYMISQRGKSIGRKSLSSKSWKRNMDIKLDFGEWDNCPNISLIDKKVIWWNEEEICLRVNDKCEEEMR